MTLVSPAPQRASNTLGQGNSRRNEAVSTNRPAPAQVFEYPNMSELSRLSAMQPPLPSGRLSRLPPAPPSNIPNPPPLQTQAYPSSQPFGYEIRHPRMPESTPSVPIPMTDAQIDAAFRVKGVVELQKDPGSDRVNIVEKKPHTISLLLNILLLASRLFLLVAWIAYLIDPVKLKGTFDFIRNFYWINILVEVPYLIELFCSSTLKYLWNETSSHGVREHIVKMKQVRPEISMWCECYHYETSVRYVTETYYEGGVRKTRQRKENYQVKVVTHTETKYFEFSHCIEASQMISDDIYYNDLIKIKLTYGIAFGDDQTRDVYNYQLQAFISRNRSRDTHFTYDETRKVPGFVDKLFSRNGENKSRFIGWTWYLLISLLGFSWPYRVWLEAKCVRGEFNFKYLVFANPNVRIL